MEWRYLLFMVGGITLLVFFLCFAVFNFQESPKYLSTVATAKERTVYVLQ
jgi:hypothetical protein